MTALQAGARIDGRDLWGLALRIVALIVGLMAAVWVVVTALPLVLLLLIALILAAGLSRPVDRLQQARLRAGSRSCCCIWRSCCCWWCSAR